MSPLPLQHTSLPSLFPASISSQAQHIILTGAQYLLEECCFEFARRWFPDHLTHRGWDCPAAVELTSWVTVLDDQNCRELLASATSLDGSTLDEVFRRLRGLRNSAVHRVPNTARTVSHFLDNAIQLAKCFNDHPRAARLVGMKLELDSKIQNWENVQDDAGTHCCPQNCRGPASQGGTRKRGTGPYKGPFGGRPRAQSVYEFGPGIVCSSIVF